MNIPIARPYLGKEEAEASAKVIESGWVTQGPQTERFENEVTAYTGAQYGVAVSSCTTALHLSLHVSGIGAGDEVICPSMSYIATANAIVYTGATPVFAEIDPATYNLDIEDVKKRISSKTKAIILVHQMGMPANLDSFISLAKEKEITLIEDAACAIGSVYKDKKIGCHSDLACFSFHPRKIITTGDGGMITTNDKKLADRLKKLRQHSMSVNDRVRHNSKAVITEEYTEIGFNYRITDIQAALGTEQMKKLDYIVQRRREIAKTYEKALDACPYIVAPVDSAETKSNFQSYSIRLTDNSPINRDSLMQKLLNNGIATRRGIMNIHREKPYQQLFPGITLPISEKTADQSLCIPLFPQMTQDEVEYVMESILAEMK